ncbi:ABC transporter ATP-binding protein [Aliihoeflea sp. PC F10.4]
MSAESDQRTEAPVIEGRNLHRRFGGRRGILKVEPVVHAVSDVSLAVSKGETFAIVGESGCGKSTLGRLLLRLIEPSEGQVFYQGRDITNLPAGELRKLRREMQIIFQDPFASLNPRMSVGSIISEPLRLHGLARGKNANERVSELLSLVGLRPEAADRYPHEFSGGQRQRIGIARALASDPTLIIGDEPVSALDVSVQAQVINLLEELKERLGLTLLIVAHDLAVIRHMSDRVAVMYLGELVELAPVNNLYDNPLHPYSQALLKAIPVASVDASRAPRELLQGDVPSPTAPPSGCRFHTRCPHARPLCSEKHPKLEPADGGTQVACHFWREIQNAGSSLPLLAGAASRTSEARLALYRSAQAGALAVKPTAASTQTVE